MSLWCDDFYVTPQGYYIRVITRLLHQGISRLLRHGDVDQSQTVSKSADFRCEKMHFRSSESRESRIFRISALKTSVSKNKTKLFSTCNLSIVIEWLSYRDSTSSFVGLDCLVLSYVLGGAFAHCVCIDAYSIASYIACAFLLRALTFHVVFFAILPHFVIRIDRWQ